MALVEGRDYYIEAGRYVFTAEYLLQRGYCCGHGCRHCPYRFRAPSEQLVSVAFASDQPVAAQMVASGFRKPCADVPKT
ncbi:MAG: DUF5522 domain-containing protein [Chloracidobacterium sp.]|nr:DUF5522 domain-containing protein [Chloracidobacterium sp.]MDW8216462.1 DUF5522 domain-containing protein [Acidobacteriota bacterium]